jgi:hypothetical protein
MNFTEHRGEWLLCLGEMIVSFDEDDASSWSIAFSAKPESLDIESENDSLGEMGLFDTIKSDGQVLSVCRTDTSTASYEISLFVSRKSLRVWHRLYTGMFFDLIAGHGRSPSSPPVYIGISPPPIEGYGPEEVA